MKFLAYFILLILAFPTFAQEIKVRSGAHEGFSRVVLDVPAGTKWKADDGPKQVRLELFGHTGGYDTSTIFDRIDRSYISSFSSSNSTLLLQFSCDCNAEVFELGENMIVLDIAQRPRTDIAAKESEVNFRFVGLQPLQFRLEKNDVDPENINLSQFTQELDASPEVGELVINPNLDDIRNRISDTDTRYLQETQRNISEGIGVAATRGILSSRLLANKASDHPVNSVIDLQVFDPPVLATGTLTGAETLKGNVRISSSGDTIDPSLELQKSTTMMGVSCIESAKLSVQSWGSEIGMSETVSSLRSQLFGEFDRINYEIAIELVRTYLFYGFGAEAKQVLMMEPALSQQNPELLSVSEIMEFGHARTTEYLKRYMDCEGDTALWSTLSDPNVVSTTAINVQAALLSLSSLPMHLRRFVAPELSRRLLAYGDQDGAAAALRSLERTSEPLSSNANLAKADLELAQGNTKRAQERLAQVVESSVEQSAEALIKYVNSHLDEDSQIEEGIATLVEAYAIEMRDDPISEDLQRTHVLALGKSGQFKKAFEALSRIRAREQDRDIQLLQTTIIDLLIKNADAPDFLTYAFNQMAIEPGGIAPQTRLRLAARLADLGFHLQAEKILDAEDEYISNPEYAAIKARVSLALGRPQEAIAHLFGETSNEADYLRAKAELQSGEFEQAYSRFAKIGDVQNRERAAWLSDSWTEYLEKEAPVLGPILEISQNDMTTSPDLEGMLGRATAAILESQNAREVLTQMLESDGLGLTDK